MIWQAKGPAGYFKNRVYRVLLPLIAALVLLGGVNRWLAVQVYNKHGANAVAPSANYLWFLFYLMVFALVAVILGRLGSSIRWANKLAESRLTQWLAGSFLSVWFCWVPAALLSNVQEIVTAELVFDGPGGALNLTPLVFLFGWCFMSGWWLFANRETALAKLEKKWWISAALGFGALSFIYSQKVNNTDKPSTAFTYVVGALWLTQAVVGATLKFAHRENKVVSYLSQASYWTYLAHLPVVWLYIAFFMKADASPIASTIGAILFAFTVCLISYQLLVRKTFVGKFLNGRRF